MWERKKNKIARQRAKSLIAWYRWQYNIAPKKYPQISIYEIELELLAKKKATEKQEITESGKQFYDSELEPEEMAGELERLIGLEHKESNKMEEVSLSDALEELK